MSCRPLGRIDLDRVDLLFIENVGNLICPVGFDLGQDVKVGMFSVTEGDDKPAKHPFIVAEAAAIILNKMDLLPYVPFRKEVFMGTTSAASTPALLCSNSLSPKEMGSVHGSTGSGRAGRRGLEHRLCVHILCVHEERHPRDRRSSPPSQPRIRPETRHNPQRARPRALGAAGCLLNPPGRSSNSSPSRIGTPSASGPWSARSSMTSSKPSSTPTSSSTLPAPNPPKHRIARRLLDTFAPTRSIVISTQVLQEFYVVATRKGTLTPHLGRQMIGLFRSSSKLRSSHPTVFSKPSTAPSSIRSPSGMRC